MRFVGDEESVRIGDGTFVVDGERFEDEGDPATLEHVVCFGRATEFTSQRAHPFDTT